MQPVHRFKLQSGLVLPAAGKAAYVICLAMIVIMIQGIPVEASQTARTEVQPLDASSPEKLVYFCAKEDFARPELSNTKLKFKPFATKERANLEQILCTVAAKIRRTVGECSRQSKIGTLSGLKIASEGLWFSGLPWRHCAVRCLL